MPLLQILEVLVVVGVLLWLVNRFIPMQGSIKSILNGVVVIAVVSVAFERVRALSLAVPVPRRNLADPVRQVSHSAECVTQIHQTSAAGICLQESILKSKVLLAVESPSEPPLSQRRNSDQHFDVERTRCSLAEGAPRDDESSRSEDRERSKTCLELILIVILILALLGALPRWSHSRSWGYAPTGGVGLVLLVVVVLLVLGRI